MLLIALISVYKSKPEEGIIEPLLSSSRQPSWKPQAS